MFRSLFPVAVLVAFTPLAANTGEIALLSSIKLQIGGRDRCGSYWSDDYWHNRNYWHCNYKWRKNRWWCHDNGCRRGWGRRRAYERDYRGGWRDHDGYRRKDRDHGCRHQMRPPMEHNA